jgi:hypothetical protein
MLKLAVQWLTPGRLLLYTHIYICIHIYIYIERERERERIAVLCVCLWDFKNVIGEADSAEEPIKLDESLIMDIQELDDALYGVLTTLTDGEAGTIVENAKGVGQEA